MFRPIDRPFRWNRKPKTLILIISGCDAESRWSSETPPPEQPVASRLSGVAVVDLDEVARQLGKDANLVAAIKQGQESLRSGQSSAAAEVAGRPTNLTQQR